MAVAHQNWSSRFTFLFAAVGSAVGLGNIWRFPYIVGENGGSAFIILYIAFVVLIGWPVLVAELSIGRWGKQSPPKSLSIVADENGRSQRWSWVGGIGAFAGGLGLLSFYSVIAGWVMAYTIKSASGLFVGYTEAEASATLTAHYADTWPMVFWHLVFIGLTVFIVGRGIKAGLEKAVTILMPFLFLILIALVVYAATTPGFGKAVDFIFTPDFSKITPATVLTAAGQAFFSLGLTVGTMIAYGSYLSRETNIMGSAGMIAGADTFIALVAGFAIFPLVFTYGLAPAEGPGLIFSTLTVAFGQMPGGVVFGTLFFLMLVIAAITSSISLLEPAVSYFEEKQGISRWGATLIAGGMAFFVGLLTVFSFNIWSDFAPFAFIGVETVNGGTATFYAIIDFLVSNVIMPVGGLLLAIFVGWAIAPTKIRDQLVFAEDGMFRVWHGLLKYLCPIVLIIVIVAGLT